MKTGCLIFAYILLGCITASAQNIMRIHDRDGSVYDIHAERVDSITFVDADSLTVVEAELSGSWLWGGAEQGYYELLSFNKDHTYTAYDNYFTYGFDTTTYGFYSQYGTMLTLWSNGFGYNRRYNWYIIGQTENALEVMTKMGPFTYYRLQPDIIRIRVGETFSISENYNCIFADGIVVKINDFLLTGITPGETYILKMDNSTKMVWANKVIVTE